MTAKTNNVTRSSGSWVRASPKALGREAEEVLAKNRKQHGLRSETAAAPCPDCGFLYKSKGEGDRRGLRGHLADLVVKVVLQLPVRAECLQEGPVWVTWPCVFLLAQVGQTLI